MDYKTIRRGMDDIEKGSGTSDRIRHKGGGRKKISDNYFEIIRLIEEIIEPDTRGDPESPLRWTCKSVRNIADFLKSEGHQISHQTVANILHDLEYSLQGNKKTKEGKEHPDRDQQFCYINKTVKRFISKRNPVISVDTKKKELIGNYKNVGKELCKKGCPEEVNSHDFPEP